MCVHFQSWNRCSSCFLTFNRRRNRVPCWNGSLSRWRVHRHGLSCRSGWYERADDEVYTHLFCEACALDADDHAHNNNNNNNANHHHVDGDSKAVMMEACRGGRRRTEDEATALTTDVATSRDMAVAKKRRVRSLNGVFARLFSLGDVLRVCKTRKGKRRFRVRIWML
ncbi:hypothetical protein BBK36DRAFT_1144197 [Trichoderma citrinoviride]|uniref:Uncharacterized protein n=1 Tax=Trichoderma citrinoviride TaxID=58853 RepID=A0A2T4B1M4_9HYPO|nr:hypothetical protein BBK36DRAFT_1144197 [Trichoderma citrinoviride]PTB63138.1 hypothetical protein BBK36DRAFT_1144197 [Trichoderma citrinoviride]